MKKLKVQEALKGKVKPTKVFIYGREEYLTRQFLKKLLKGVKHEKFTPENLEDFLNFTGSSLFEGEVMPVLVHAEELPSKLRKKSEREKFLKKLKSLDSFVVAAFGELDWKSLKGELFSEIINLSEFVVEAEPYTEKQLYGLLLKKFKSAGKEVSPEVIKFIVETVGSDLTELKQETDKLIAYPGKLTLGVVKELLYSGGKVDPFSLLFPLIEGKKREFIERAQKLLEEGMEPLFIIGILQSQIRNLALISAGKSVRLPKSALESYKALSRKAGLLKLLKALKELHSCEFSIKSGREEGRESLLKLPFKV
ncbi:DNA polymerase III subunit delta [Thermovibrio sp.]